MATGSTSTRDPTISAIAGLTPQLAGIAVAMVNAARSAGYPLIVTSGRRSGKEQEQLVASGHSRTYASKHLQGRAFDVDIYGLARDDVPQWFWDLLGPWAEMNLGLRWGGRWSSIYDPGHFEL